jgi:hypothetical protein
MTNNLTPPSIRAISEAIRPGIHHRCDSEGHASAVRIERIIGQRRAGLWFEPTPFRQTARPVRIQQAQQQQQQQALHANLATPRRRSSDAKTTGTHHGCAPSTTCLGHPDCPKRNCEGHPDNDASTYTDHAARATFWRWYLAAVLCLFVLVGFGTWAA